ncbi:nitroreductase family protein [Erysipelothrix larvae]|uniref:nitroreductase family protein n=1 Tax=Erysipelothrix larvae TaxID=1514105 RepID=UPI001E3FB7D7|nr:nitroreductase family protein [Erysipelothrix larvae]
MSSFSDCLLACQNVMVAAESMGLGGVILGSILNDAQQLIEILELPKLTFPIIGLVVGYPDQQPQLKPRLPQELIHFENKYCILDNYHEALQAYDAVVTEYYDLRDMNNRIDSFTLQATKSQQTVNEGRLKLKKTLEKQGLLVK